MGAADLLLPLEQALHVQRQTAGRRQQRLDGLEVREQLPLVVARAAAVHISAIDACRKRRKPPLTQRSRRLHVVVTVDQRRGLAARPRPFRIDDGMPRCRQFAHALQADRLQMRRQPSAAPLHVGRPRRLAADARDADELLELTKKARLVLAHERCDGDAGNAGLNGGQQRLVQHAVRSTRPDPRRRGNGE